MRLPHTYIIRCLWAPGSQLQATGAKGLSSARVCVGTSRLVESGAFLPPGIAFSSAWEIRSPLSSFWLFYFTTEVYAGNCFLHPTSCLSAGFRGTLCSLPTAGSICGSSRQGPRSPSSAPGREFLAGWRAGTNRRKATRRILVGKPGGRRPKASRSTFPLGPSRKEAPLPGTWRPETGLRTEAPGSSAPSPSRPLLACCSSPFTRFSLSVLVVFHSLCVLGDGKPPPLPPPQPAEVTPPPRQCLRRELVPPSPNRGKRENLQQQATGSCAGSQGSALPGARLRGLESLLLLEGPETRAAQGAGQVSASPTAPRGRAGISCGVALTQKRHLTTGRAGAQAAHRATSQRHFHGPIQPWKGLGERRNAGGGRILQWQ